MYLNLADALRKAADEAAQLENEIVSLRIDQKKQQEATKLLVDILQEAINQYKANI